MSGSSSAPEAAPVLTLDGAAVHDISSFYDEINRVFMIGVEWRLGESLDALDDLLYGGYGVLLAVDRAVVVWRDHETARRALGVETTRKWLQDKLDRPAGFATDSIAEQLAAVEVGTGPTYFDLVLEVFAEHPSITLQLA